MKTTIKAAVRITCVLFVTSMFHMQYQTFASRIAPAAVVHHVAANG
ncbi:MAG TPA: hypothetical protein VFK85_03445 [Anaeromyxobacteraceae bacterium]|nr:hypothetical protein [Anaeromyxobacteraceae bacterium]